MHTRLRRSLVPPVSVFVLLACNGKVATVPEDPTEKVAGLGPGKPSTTAFGAPLPGLPPDRLAAFQEGLVEFADVEGVEDGLGPVFNGTSCAGCHAAPAIGGGSATIETRFGTITAGQFDPLASLGGSLIQTQGIGGTCNITGEVVPATATIQTGRLTTPLFGLGLVDAVPDATFVALAARESPDVAGRVAIVANVMGGTSVGKFGWKAQVPTLHQFAGDAYLNEMGITSPDFPTENCPQGDCSLLVCDPVADPEDDGTSITAFTDFMTLLAPPPPGPSSAAANRGGAKFLSIGCAGCHTPQLRTGPNALAALDHVKFAPYSDFLLHDMGGLGDGIVQGAASATEMRTAPLWGARARTRFLHDGRATNVGDAILAHDGQGLGARNAFVALGPSMQADLLAFIDTL